MSMAWLPESSHLQRNLQTTPMNNAIFYSQPWNDTHHGGLFLSDRNVLSPTSDLHDSWYMERVSVSQTLEAPLSCCVSTLLTKYQSNYNSCGQFGPSPHICDFYVNHTKDMLLKPQLPSTLKLYCVLQSHHGGLQV